MASRRGAASSNEATINSTLGKSNLHVQSVAHLLNLPEFASSLADRVNSELSDEGLVFELQSHLRSLTNGSVVIPASRLDEVDSQATQLWNTGVRLWRVRDFSCDKKLLVLLRVFAFLLLDSAQGSKHGQAMSNLRVFGIAIKAVKSCLQQNELDLALTVLQKIAAYEESLGNTDIDRGNQVQQQVVVRVRAEYYGLRITLVFDASFLNAFVFADVS